MLATPPHSRPLAPPLFGSLVDRMVSMLAPSMQFDDAAIMAERDLSAFIDQAWHVVEPSTRFVPGFHLDAIAEHLVAVTNGEIRNLLINVPPRHMKSLAVSVFWPTWEWIRHPERRWLYSAYALSLSVRDSLKCRRLIESPWYQERWGDRFQLTTDQNVKARYDNNKTGYRIATSVGGSATGEGGDRVVVDDPHSAMEALSDVSRESALIWWDQTMSTRLNDPKTGAKVIVMQRLHESDLSGHVLDQGGYEHLCLPAEYEPTTIVTGIGWSDLRTEPGELLWPEQFGQTEIDQLKKDLGSQAAAGQLQQRPSPAEGGILKRYWWKFWHFPGQSLPPVPMRMDDGSLHLAPCVPLPPFWDEHAQSWDMSFKDTAGSDYVAGQVWGAWRADRFLLDQILAQLDFPATLAAVRELTDRWPKTRRKLVEDKANGPAVIATLKHEISGLIAVEPEGGKIVRAHAVTPEIESGNVYLPHPRIAPWIDSFITECASFPNAANDDQVDAMTQALIRLAVNDDSVTIVTSYLGPDEDDDEERDRWQ